MAEAGHELDSEKKTGTVPLVLALTVGGILAAGAFMAVQRWEHDRARDAFEAVAAEGARTVERRARLHAGSLDSGGAVYRSAGDFGRVEFEDYADALLRHRRETVLVLWLPRVTDDERDAFEEEAHAAGVPEYRIVELDGRGQPVLTTDHRDEYFPVRYTAPQSAGRALLGIDLAAEARFREVMHAAARDGRVRASGRLPFSDAQAGRYGVGLFRPVYDVPPSGLVPSERPSRLGGFLVLLVDTGGLIEEALAGTPAARAGIVVTDRDATQGGRVLYRRPVSVPSTSGAARAWWTRLAPEGLEARRTIVVGGRDWMLTFTPGASYLSAPARWSAPVIASAVFGFVLLAVRKARRRRPTRESEATLKPRAERSESGEQARLECELRDLQARLAEVEAVAGLGSWRWNPGDGSMSWSPGLCALLGLDPGATVPDLGNFTARICDSDRARVRHEMERAATSGADVDTTVCVMRGGGARSSMRLRARAERDPETGELRLVGTVSETARPGRDERHIRTLAAALHHSSDTVMLTDPEGTIVYVNAAFERVTGFGRAEAVGRNASILKSDRHDVEFYAGLWDTIRTGESFRDVFVNRKKDGTLYYEEKTITPLKDTAGRIVSFVSIGKEITQRMQDQERLQHLAYHDLLTELPNRALFMDRLMHALLKRRKTGTRLAVLFLDTDEFKQINDTLGHAVGDRVLQLLAERVTSCVREGDTVARIGGDEFAVLLEEVGSPDDVSAIAQKILDALGRTLRVDEHDLLVTISIGISLFPDDGEAADTLLSHADDAMYRAKQEGRASYQFYSAVLEHRALARLTYESELHRAIERDEFTIYYQPQVDVRSGRARGIGVEALIRWRHPESGLIGPDDFIPKLESMEQPELITLIGEWVLRSACEQAAGWRREGIDPFRLSVNISGRQFHQRELHRVVAAVLRETGFDPYSLELEITERALMRHDKASRDNLQALQDLGVRLAIDDFGVGYSSLSSLKSLPVDTIKIDRMFIGDMAGKRNDAGIVSAIIAMGRNLGLEVVAEGVETEAQVEFLRRHGCYLMQGFLFSRPLPAQELSRLIA